MAIARFGAWPEQDFFTELIAGAPGAPSSSGSGMARWVGIDRSTGQLDPSTAHPTDETGTVTGAPEKLGATVAAANVFGSGALHGLTVGLGEEVIIGAPGTEGGSSGSIHLFATRITTSLIGTDRSEYDWYEYGSLTGPSSTSRFGEAIAVWPNVVMPNVSGWFAVGAPGADEVQIIGRQPFGWPPPPAVKQIISSTSVGIPTGSDFGAALTIEDFDGDGQMDLAIGAPGADEVVIVRGQAGVTPLDTTDILAVSSPLATASGFGSALASGNIYGVGQEVGLVIGAPDDGDGQVCTVGVDQGFSVVQPGNGGTDPLCGASPYTGSAPHRWGATVAVGNVIPRDVYGQTSSDDALVEEVIVGAPGADRSTWSSVTGGFTASTSTTATGQIAVLQGIYQDGPRLPDGSPVPSDALPRTDLSTGPSGSEFGAALVVADLERSGHPDIIAGAPGWSPGGSSDEYGAVQLLNSASVNGFHNAEGGIFQATDSNDRLVDVIVFGAGSSTYLSTGDDVFFIEYVKDDGSVCSLYDDDINAVFTLNLNLQHTLGDGDSTTLEDLILDTSTGELVGSHRQAIGKPLRFDLIVSDANFDSSTSTDQVSITLSNVRQHLGQGQWASIYGNTVVPGIANECDIRNGPTFTMPRTQTWDASCD